MHQVLQQPIGAYFYASCGDLEGLPVGSPPATPATTHTPLRYHIYRVCVLLPHLHPCRISPPWASWTGPSTALPLSYPLECPKTGVPHPQTPQMLPPGLSTEGAISGVPPRPFDWHGHTHRVEALAAYLPLCPPPGPPKNACPSPSCPLAFIMALIFCNALHSTPPWTFTWVRYTLPPAYPTFHTPTHPTLLFHFPHTLTTPTHPHLYPHA